MLLTSPSSDVTAKLYRKFSPRDQYLLKHQGKVYYELYDGGEGMFSYRRQPQYLAQIFAPIYRLPSESLLKNWLARTSRVLCVMAH